MSTQYSNNFGSILERRANARARNEHNLREINEKVDNIQKDRVLAALGASMQLHQLQASRAGLAKCADNCSCDFCSRQSQLVAIINQAAPAQVPMTESQQKVAAANNAKLSATTLRKPKFQQISDSLHWG
jgi:hypothetical protein